jgi:hypothetical protein
MCSDGGLEECRDILISVSVLPYWERLWCMRSNLKFKPQVFDASDRYKYMIPDRSTRMHNFEEDFFDTTFGESGKMVPIVLTLTFLVYGGVHLLAWQYNFQTNAEGLMWRISSTVTASSGFILFSSILSLKLTIILSRIFCSNDLSAILGDVSKFFFFFCLVSMSFRDST